MNKSFWWLIVVLIVVIIGGLYLRGDKTTTTPEEEVVKEQALVPPTGNLSDVVEAIVSEIENEELTPDEADAAIVGTDDALIDSFDEALDANQF